MDRLEESVKELEENSTSMGPSETAKAASNLTREIQVKYVLLIPTSIMILIVTIATANSSE